MKISRILKTLILNFFFANILIAFTQEHIFKGLYSAIAEVLFLHEYALKLGVLTL